MRRFPKPHSDILPRRRPWPSLVGVALVAAATLAQAAGMGDPAGTARPERLRARLTRAEQPLTVSNQVTAHDGKFWIGSTQILLHGINASPIAMSQGQNDLTDADYATIASWGMNFVRYRVRWSYFEPTAPTKNGSVWSHSYNTNAVQTLEDQIALAQAHGIYVLIENYCGPPCYGNGWPDWLYQAPNNSHGREYTDATSANTDFWTDGLQQQFNKAWMTFLAGQLAATPGVVGYDILNEPNQGTYADGSSTTQMMLSTEYQLAQAVRAADPARVIFFQARGPMGSGLPNANLSTGSSPFAAMGNVAFEVHDYFGGAWGQGISMDPADPLMGEHSQDLLNFTLTPGVPPYVGTTASQVRFTQVYTDKLSPLGIPLLIGEFAGQGEDEPNILGLFGTMCSAFNDQNVSWAAQSYNGANTVFKSDGTEEPWVAVLESCAA
jgi:aryl-phospho-beta-D-glucosidase BglC (GH1 family)